MIVQNLTKGSLIYTSNAYLCSGENESGSHLLIDTGCDPQIMNTLHRITAETRQPPVSDVILTHSHYDHTRILKEIKAAWPMVKTYAYSAYLDGIEQVLTDGEKITACNTTFEIIHVPGHSTDSVCVYSPEHEILFSGDSPLIIWGTEATYELTFVTAFKKLAQLRVSAIYPGHGEPILQDCNRILDQSLHNLQKSRII